MTTWAVEAGQLVKKFKQTRMPSGNGTGSGQPKGWRPSALWSAGCGSLARSVSIKAVSCRVKWARLWNSVVISLHHQDTKTPSLI